MYREDYRERQEDYSSMETSRNYYPLPPPPPPPPPRDPYYDDRTRDSRSYEFEDLERKRYGPGPGPGPSPVDDPFYSPPLSDLEPRHSRSSDTLLDDVQDPNTGTIACGSVIVIPLSPFDPRPKRRDKPPVCKTVFVGSLPDNTTHKHLSDLFSKCGRVTDVRISKGRNFGHVQFEFQDDVERALTLSGCRIRVGPSNTLSDVSMIHVDYAQSRIENDTQKRHENAEPLIFNTGNAGLLVAELHRDDSFSVAAKNILVWIERGRCIPKTTNTFFGLISSCNIHCRKLAKKMKDLEKEEEEWRQRKQTEMETLERDCKLVEDVLTTACTQRAWDHFTKPQRKSLSQWKDYATSLRSDMNNMLTATVNEYPQAKKPRLKSPTVENNAVERKQELEKMKLDYEAALVKKQNQVMQLNSLISKFQQSFPEEWEKMVGGGGAKKSPVAITSQNTPTALELESSENSLAVSAAAYAKTRATVGSLEETSSSSLSDADIAIVTVLSVYLTVNPLGATLDEIASYVQNLNPAITSIYLESLLRRQPHVFQFTQQQGVGGGVGGGGGGGGGRWWYLGFQTCCRQTGYDETVTKFQQGQEGGGGEVYGEGGVSYVGTEGTEQSDETAGYSGTSQGGGVQEGGVEGEEYGGLSTSQEVERERGEEEEEEDDDEEGLGEMEIVDMVGEDPEEEEEEEASTNAEPS